MTQWIWQQADWPRFFWEERLILTELSRARLVQGKLLGRMQSLNADASQKLVSSVLTEQAIDTSAIEGEHLNRDSVRSSIADRLGFERAGVQQSPDRYVDGLVDMLLDASKNYSEPLSLERLFGWHAALFPIGYSGIKKITVAQLRQFDPMQIVSGQPHKLKVHYEAPPAKLLKKQITDFLTWFNSNNKDDGLLHAGIAHLWFELLHPFDDGNGRIGRAIIDLALARDEQRNLRAYSLSSAIMQDRKNYYASLEKICCGDLDITAWLMWFLKCLQQAIINSNQLIDNVVKKSRFWEYHANTVLNDRQIKVLNRLLDAGEEGFSGGMTTRKYSALTKTSRATAYRELADLVDKNCLRSIVSKGRSAAYQIQWV